MWTYISLKPSVRLVLWSNYTAGVQQKWSKGLIIWWSSRHLGLEAGFAYFPSLVDAILFFGILTQPRERELLLLQSAVYRNFKMSARSIFKLSYKKVCLSLFLLWRGRGFEWAFEFVSFLKYKENWVHVYTWGFLKSPVLLLTGIRRYFRCHFRCIKDGQSSLGIKDRS